MEGHTTKCTATAEQSEQSNPWIIIFGIRFPLLSNQKSFLKTESILWPPCIKTMGNWASSWVAGLKIPPNWRFLLFFHFREAFPYNWCDISKAWLFLSTDKYNYKFTHNFDFEAPHYLLMIHTKDPQYKFPAPLSGWILRTICGHWPFYWVSKHFMGSRNSQGGKELGRGNSLVHTNRPNTVFALKY